MSDSPSVHEFRPSGGVQIETKRIPEKGILPIMLLGEPESLIIHWQGKDGLPCQGELCPKARHACKPQWKLFAPGRWYCKATGRWVKAVMELTAIMWDDMKHETPLRGTYWECIRIKPPGKKGENRARLFKRVPAGDCEIVFNHRQHVEAMFRMGGLDWGAKNPFISRVYDEPVEMPDVVVPVNEDETADADPADYEKSRAMLEAELKKFRGR